MSFFYRHPKVAVMIIMLATLVLGRFAGHSTINNRLEENVVRDIHLTRYYEFLEEFGNDRILIAAVPFEKLDRKLLTALFELEEQLLATGGVEKIISPLSILKEAFDLRKREDMMVWLESDKRISNFEQRLRQFTVLDRTIVSFKTKTIGMVLKISSSISDTNTELIYRLKRLIEDHPAFDGNANVTGVPELMRILHGYTKFSQKVFTPACLVVIALVLLLLYRSKFGVLVPLAAVLAPLIWTLGLYNIRESSTNFITTMVPPLLLGIGMTSCIHLVTAYFHNTRELDEFSMTILVDTVKDQAPPIIMCQVTTLFGFFTLAANGIGAVCQYGLYSAMGVIFVLITVFFLIPSLIIIFKVTKQRVTALQTAFSIFEPLARFVIKGKWWIIGISALSALIGINGLTKLNFESSLLRLLPSGHQASQDIRRVEEKLCGVVPFHLCLARNGKGLEDSLLDPKLCKQLAKLQEAIEKIPNVDQATSYINLIQDYDRIFSGEEDNIPPSAEEIEEYLDFYRPNRDSNFIRKVIHNEDGTVKEIQLLEEKPKDKGSYSPVDWFLTRDYQRGHIALRVRDITSREYAEIFEKIETLTKDLPKDVSHHLTGRAYLWTLTSEILVRNEVANFFLALAIICVVIIIHFRSLTVGILAIFPNVLPLIVLYGGMGYRGMAINTVTGMIACVAIGMAVDDTIHYIYAFRKHRLDGQTVEEAIIEAMREKGSSMVFTTLVIMTGFLVLLLSEFPPTFQFGGLISCTFLMALILDLMLTPSILLVLRPFAPAESKELTAAN